MLYHFSKALIPYNPRNESSLKKVGYNKYGYIIGTKKLWHQKTSVQSSSIPNEGLANPAFS